MVTSKSVLTVTSLAVALLFGGGIYVLINLNALAKPYTEKLASQAMGVDVSIGDMDIDLKAKSVVVNNIKIDNPPGYKKPHAVTVDDVKVTLNTVTKELITFKDISVGGTTAYLEVTQGGTNLQDLQKLMAAKKAEKAEPSALKVIIDRMAITGASVQPSITLLSDTDLKAANVPNLVLTGIGQKENGVLVKDAIRQVMQPLIKSFSRSAGQAGFYQGLSADVLKDLGVSQIQTLKDDINTGIENLTDDLKGIFE